MGRSLQRRFFDRDPLDVAPELLGMVLEHGRCAGRIVEVEAYRGADDAASHAFRGLTGRNAVMFGEPGHLYVYFTYGMHFCANVVCWPEGVAGAVLLRSLVPCTGLELMRERRSAGRGGGAVRRDAAGGADGAAAQAPVPTLVEERWLSAGPARLCQALGIDRSLDGADLVSGDRGARLVDDGWRPSAVASGRRVGLSARVGAAAEVPWRHWCEGDPHVSVRGD